MSVTEQKLFKWAVFLICLVQRLANDSEQVWTISEKIDSVQNLNNSRYLPVEEEEMNAQTWPSNALLYDWETCYIDLRVPPVRFFLWKEQET